jgi:hypothetical protein
MALFDFFKKFSFFGGRSTEGLREEDLDFQKWVAAHRDWRRRLLEYIDGIGKEELDETIVCQDNRCELGKWIHGNGRKFYGGEAIFQRLVYDHAAFHRSAGKVISLFKKRDEKNAHRALNSEFDLHSMHVINALEQLEHRVKS